MRDFEIEVREELEQAQHNLSRLRVLIAERNGYYDSLDKIAQARINAQREAMTEYVFILGQRIQFEFQ